MSWLTGQGKGERLRTAASEIAAGETHNFLEDVNHPSHFPIWNKWFSLTL